MVLKTFVKNRKIFFHITFVIILSVFFVVLSSCKLKDTNNSQKKVDLSAHPVYSKYDFGNNEKVIDFGTQPLAVPTGTIAELIKNDKVLNDYLSRRGIELRFHSFYKGGDINYFLKKGHIDIAVGGDMPILKAASSFPTIISAIVKQNYSSIISKKGLLLENIKGKRVGYAFGSTAHYALLKALKTVNVGEEDIKLVPMKVSEMPDAIINNKIDMFSAWEPAPTIALSLSKDLVTVHKSLSSSYLYFSKKFVDSNNDIYKQIIASLMRSLIWIKKSRDNLITASKWSVDSAEKFSGKKSAISNDSIARLIKEGILKIATSPKVPNYYLDKKGALYNEFIFLKKLEKIPDDGSWERVYKSFDQETIKEILTRPDLYKLNI